MASATSYQNFSPRALEPYPIESKLSDLAYGSYGNSPAEAQTALDQYWYERQLNEGIYGQEVQAQHEEARQNLAAQMQQQAMKTLAEAKDPTVLQLLANSDYRNLAMPGVSDATLGDLVTRARQGQDVLNLQHAGTGANQLSQGGFDPTGELAKVGITNLGPYKGPAMVQSAQLRLQGDLAKAAARSSSDKGMSFTSQPIPELGGVQLHGKAHGTTQEEATADLQGRGFGPKGLSTSDTPPSQRSGMTPLKPAQKDEGTSRSVSPAASPEAQQKMQQIRTIIDQNRSKMPAEAYKDLQDGMRQNGGNPILRKGPDGKDHLYGASGKPYS
jgi:hypothetical protein